MNRLAYKTRALPIRKAERLLAQASLEDRIGRPESRLKSGSSKSWLTKNLNGHHSVFMVETVKQLLSLSGLFLIGREKVAAEVQI